MEAHSGAPGWMEGERVVGVEASSFYFPSISFLSGFPSAFPLILKRERSLSRELFQRRAAGGREFRGRPGGGGIEEKVRGRREARKRRVTWNSEEEEEGEEAEAKGEAE